MMPKATYCCKVMIHRDFVQFSLSLLTDIDKDLSDDSKVPPANSFVCA